MTHYICDKPFINQCIRNLIFDLTILSKNLGVYLHAIELQRECVANYFKQQQLCPSYLGNTIFVNKVLVQSKMYNPLN